MATIYEQMIKCAADFGVEECLAQCVDQASEGDDVAACFLASNRVSYDETLRAPVLPMMVVGAILAALLAWLVRKTLGMAVRLACVLWVGLTNHLPHMLVRLLGRFGCLVSRFWWVFVVGSCSWLLRLTAVALAAVGRHLWGSEDLLELLTGKVCSKGLGKPLKLFDKVDADNIKVDQARGYRLFEIPGVAGHSPLPRVMRLRKHARWVVALQTQFGMKESYVGKFLRGTWAPDLADERLTGEANFLLGFVKGGVKILGGGSIQSVSYEDDKRPLVDKALREKVDKMEGVHRGSRGQVYLVVEFADGSEGMVFPNLVSRLAQYALLRQRTYDLAISVKSRARDWLTRNGIPEHYCFEAMRTALCLTLDMSDQETWLVDKLGGCGQASPPLSDTLQ